MAQPTNPETTALARYLQGIGVPAAPSLALANRFPGGLGLASATSAVLAKAAGVRGCPAWCRRIPAALALARYIGTAQADRAADKMRCPGDVAAVLRAQYGGRDQECFAVVLLDSRAKVIAIETVHVGTLSQVEVHPREIFRPAVRRGAHSVILAHNHPSMDATPSDADVDLTERLVAVGRTLGIPVADHLIVAGGNHTSLAVLGLGGLR